MADKTIREKRLTARRVFLDPSTPSSWTVARVVLIAFVVWYVADFFQNFLSSLKYLFFMIVLSIFFAYLIDPLVRVIRRPFKERNLDKLMPRWLAIIIAYVFVFTILGFGIANLAPIVTQQAKDLATNVPGYVSSVQGRLNELSERFQIRPETQTQINEKVTATIGEIGTIVTGFLLTVVSYAPWLILIPVLSFFFLKDVNLFRLLFLRMFPSGRWRARAESVLEDVNKTLRAYVRAQIFSCLLIGFVCTLGFYALEINYAILLGILAGTLEFIPLLGPLTIGSIAIVVSSVSVAPRTGLYVAIFLVVLRILQDYVFYPRIVREGIHLHPLLIILCVLAGEQVAGIPGVFISIPLVALATVIYRHVIEHRGARGVFAEWLEPTPPVEKASGESRVESGEPKVKS
ncbi:MAG: AI-2E family transporter [Acidobacteria bacterium]|nr:AI-2E family transporter [Acidobacteriota bacterium]